MDGDVRELFALNRYQIEVRSSRLAIVVSYLPELSKPHPGGSRFSKPWTYRVPEIVFLREFKEAVGLAIPNTGLHVILADPELTKWKARPGCS